MTTPLITNQGEARRDFTPYEEYLAITDDGRLIEWVNGEIIEHMPPSTGHQKLLGYLETILRYYVSALELGEVLHAPYEVKLWPGGPSREPDILFVAKESTARLTHQRVEGGPDLVVEAVSPASVTLDRVIKFQEYEQAGVREYWIIDPRPFQQQADFYVRDETGRFVPAPVGDDGVYISTVVPGFHLRVGLLWETPLPDPQRTLAEVMVAAPGIGDELRAVYRRLLELH